MRQALLLLDFEDTSADSLKLMLLSCTLQPLYIKSEEVGDGWREGGGREGGGEGGREGGGREVGEGWREGGGREGEVGEGWRREG